MEHNRISTNNITVVIQVLEEKNLFLDLEKFIFFLLPKRIALPKAGVGSLNPKSPLQQKEQHGQLMGGILTVIGFFVLFSAKEEIPILLSLGMWSVALGR